MRKINELLAQVRVWATRYEPAVAASVVAAVFQLLAGLGIAVGDLPDKADAVLAFLAVTSTLVAGRSIRKRVYSQDTHTAAVLRSYDRGIRDGEGA